MKRTEIRRTPMRSGPKQRKCPVKKGGCGAVFTPLKDGQICCIECAVAVGAWLKDRKAAEVAQNEAAEHRAKKADSKKLEHWLSLTQTVVNHLVLTRDIDEACISCGTRTTVQWEAGHYLSVGSHREIRYMLENIAKQCHRCNHYLSGNQAAYRIALVAKHGPEFVENIEKPRPVAKYTRELLAEIRKTSAAETRRLKRLVKTRIEPVQDNTPRRLP